MPIIIFLLALSICLYLARIKLFYGINRSTIVVTTLFYLVCSGSGLAVVSIIFLLLLSFVILCAKIFILYDHSQ